MSNLSAELWKAIEAYSTADSSRTHADLVAILKLMNQRMDGMDASSYMNVLLACTGCGTQMMKMDWASRTHPGYFQCDLCVSFGRPTMLKLVHHE